jgi:hypothetical protein
MPEDPMVVTRITATGHGCREIAKERPRQGNTQHHIRQKHDTMLVPKATKSTHVLSIHEHMVVGKLIAPDDPPPGPGNTQAS